MLSIPWLLLLIAVKTSPVWGNAFLNDCNGATKTTTFRMEILETYYSDQLEWKLVQDGVGVIESANLPGDGELYENELCIDPSGCYQFKLEHYYGNALDDGGFYSIFYDGELIGSGGQFEGILESIHFGNGCASPSPTDSATPMPTTSSSPTSSPTALPTKSSPPSASPSTTSQPTYAPTKSSKPTDAAPVRPIEPREGADGRLRFPDLPNRAEANKFRNNAVPDCTDSPGRVGCVALPSTLSNPRPDWAGNIYFSPPTCSLNQFGRNKQCTMGIPMSINVVEDDLNLSLLSEFQEDMIFPDTEGTTTIVVGDLDNDGHLDIVTGFAFKRNKRWMNNADGTFTPFDLQGEEEGSTRTNAIALGDLNGDNILDIIIGNEVNAPNQVLLSTDDNSYEVIELPGEKFFQRFPATTAIALGDIDGDGNIDIVVGGDFLPDTDATILLNSEGNGRFFQEHVQFIKDITAISIGDIDNDGKVDIVFATTRTNDDFIHMNKGNMIFSDVILQPLSNTMTPSETSAIKLADMNGDDCLDIVVGQVGEPVLLYINDKNGNFETIILPGGDTEVADIGLGDINGDGRVDIMVQTTNNANNVLLNMGDGNYDLNTLPEQDGTSSTVALGDLNGDGSLDFIFGMTKNANNAIWLNNIDNFVYKTRRLPAGRTEIDANAVVLADMNGDGILDVVIANGAIDNQIYMSENDGNYVSIPIQEGDKSVSRAIAVGDLNNDGILDVVVGNSVTVDQIFMGKKDNSFDAIELLSMTSRDCRGPNPKQSATTSIAIGDLDENGLLDIVMGYRRTGKGCIFGANEVFYQEKGGNFTAYALPGDDSPTNALALGDFDGDGFLDIATANEGQNQVLLYNGNRTFTATNLPSSVSATDSIAVGDVNNDDSLDIILGTKSTENSNIMLLNNRDGTYESIVLPDTEESTTTVALGDFNGDGLVDIIFGSNKISDNLLLNKGINSKGDVTFKKTDLPGGALRTQGIAIGDLDGDGFVEIVSVHELATPQITFYSSCPNGGARPFTSSWCFRCPAYTGRPASLLDFEQSSCVECLPDILQQLGDGERCSSEPCFLRERKLGSKTCDRCQGGTFFDADLTRIEKNTSSWEPDRCVECPQGTFTENGPQGTSTENGTIAVNLCYECPSGTNQSSVGQTKCKGCKPGFFQTLRGQATCDSCARGGYCVDTKSCGGGFTECEAGTYNEKTGQSNRSACIACDMGTFSIIKGANSSIVCERCPGGTFGSRIGATTCELCPKGEYQPKTGQTSCLKCNVGTFSNLTGLEECTPCPNRLSSQLGSIDCRSCAEGYYLRIPFSGDIDIFNRPDVYCQECPEMGECTINTTTETMAINEGHWRDSLLTAKLFRCNNNANVCKGFNETDAINGRRLTSETMDDSLYCKEGHRGPLCEVCTDEGNYFNDSEGECVKCPRLRWEPIVIVISFLIGFILLRMAASHYTPLGVLLTQGAVLLSNYSPQAKFKLLISFYQVVGTLRSIYGVEIDEAFTDWFNFIDFLSFDYFTDWLPTTCLGSMNIRLVVTVIYPFIVIFIGCIIIYIHALITQEKNEDYNLKTKLWGRTLKFSIIFIYIALPGSSQRIFAAYKCQAYDTNDTTFITRSYLVADPSLRCDDSNAEYASVLNLFWALFIIWPVLLPLLMFGLLWKVRHLVRAKRTTPLAEACSFLWRDYNEGYLYWEIIDLYRKLFLTGFILLIDKDEGSTRILRLLVATAVSLVYFGILLRVRPYKQAGNLDLAFVSNILLMLCFILGTVLHFCDDNGEVECKRYIGRGFTSYRASLLVVLISIAVLVLTVSFLVIFAINAIHTPSVRVISTGSKPNLELPGDCKFHAFFSHIWSTGKDKTHAAVRKMQLFLPGVRIWLDADELTHVDQLEASVESCVVILIFYTEGYFRSTNCRREVYAAVSADKPIYVIYERDITDLEGMREECYKYCNEGENILEKVFANDPIPWLGSSGSSFAIESIKLVSLSILRHLPFYLRVPGQLNTGIKIAGECMQVKLPCPVEVLVCEGNVGARRIAEEAKTHLPGSGDRLNICDAQLILDELSKDFSTLLAGTVFFLLYLDENVFLDDEKKVSELVRMALGLGIKVLMVHELDYTRGACEFNTFFSQTPEDLIGALFKDIAVPLYPMHEYRQVSFRSLLAQMGANETGKLPPKRNIITSAALLITTSLRNLHNPNTLSAARERWAEN